MKGYYVYLSIIVILAIIGIAFAATTPSKGECKKEAFQNEEQGPKAISNGVPEAMLDSMYADPANSSCIFYIKTYKTMYDSLLKENTPEAARRRIALAVLVAARGKFSGAMDSDLTYMDGCVVPKELISIFGMGDDCRVVKKDDMNRTFTLQLKPSPTYMEPKGCMLDFGNKVEPSTNEMGQQDFYRILDQLYFSMNNDLINNILAMKNQIENLQRDLEIARGTIGNLEVNLNAANNNINTLTRDRDSARSDRDTCNTNLSSTRNNYETASANLNQASAKLAKYSTQVPLISMFNDWHSPGRERKASYKDIGLYNELSKTFMFWLRVEERRGAWRNIFHVTSGEDMNRRPAVFINPSASRIHICHDTEKTVNNPIDIDIDFKRDVHVALSWSKQSLDIYLNGTLRHTHNYDSAIKQSNSDSSLFISDLFNYYEVGGYFIKGFKIFNYTMLARHILEEMNR
jgi:hypothetical protein